MRRFVTLALLCFCSIPFGVSISGCHHAAAPDYCNGQTSGVQVGQTTTLDLEPRLTGISLNQGQIGQVGTPSAKDCQGNAASASGVTFGSSNLSLVDVQPTTGRLCAGTFNRQTGGGIADYTFCTPGTANGIAYLTASAQGVTSNAIPVYVHPVVTSVVLGGPSLNCATDPATNCYDPTQAGACLATPVAVTSAYTGNSCISQGSSAQLVGRIFAGSGSSQTNVSCQVGPLTFNAQNSSIVTIDTNGLATAAQPGSTTINANISQASSTAGFFATCPPASIVLSKQGSTSAPTGPISVNQNSTQALVATVIDTKGVPITNIALEFESTSPTTIPATSGSITPIYPGAAAITALCQPPTCNPSPLNEIGLFGTGTTITSNPVNIVSIGTGINSVIYIASTQSQYLQPVDFTLPTQGPPIRLPYVPNSMVLSEDQSTIYLGTPNELMVVGTTNNALVKEDTTVSGTVLAVSPDNNTVVITDPVRKLIYLYAAGGSIYSEYGGVGTRAAWTPDSQTVYITTNDGRMLAFSNFTGWTPVPLANVATDVAVTVPNAGVYLANGSAGGLVDERTNCPLTTINGSGISQTTTNTFYPDLGPVAENPDRVIATNDGLHILGANISSFFDDTTNRKSGACPVLFTNSVGAPLPLGVAATAIREVIPTSDSAYAFVTYQGTGGTIPEYTQSPAPGGAGTITDVPLQKTANGTPIAPVSAVLAADNQTLFVGTSGDDIIHRLTRGATGFTDSLTPIVPLLPVAPGFTGPYAVPDLLVQRPKKPTS